MNLSSAAFPSPLPATVFWLRLPGGYFAGSCRARVLDGLSGVPAVPNGLSGVPTVPNGLSGVTTVPNGLRGVPAVPNERSEAPESVRERLGASWQASPGHARVQYFSSLPFWAC